MQSMADILWVWTLFIAATSPVPTNFTKPYIKPSREEPPSLPPSERPDKSYGNPPSHRAGYLVLSMAAMGLLGGLIGRVLSCPTRPCSSEILGYRIRHMGRNSLKTLTPTHYLMFAQYFLALAYLNSGAILVCEERGIAMQVLSSLTQIPAKRSRPSVHDSL
jgi:hypothetical protein